MKSNAPTKKFEFAQQVDDGNFIHMSFTGMNIKIEPSEAIRIIENLSRCLDHCTVNFKGNHENSTPKS